MIKFVVILVGLGEESEYTFNNDDDKIENWFNDPSAFIVVVEKVIIKSNSISETVFV